jgi:hypothetical protein
MSRYVVPVAFLAATLWVGWYNRSHGASKVLLPMVDVVFPQAGPQELGEHSLQAMIGATVAVTALTVWEHVRAVRKPSGG